MEANLINPNSRNNWGPSRSFEVTPATPEEREHEQEAQKQYNFRVLAAEAFLRARGIMYSPCPLWEMKKIIEYSHEP